MVFTIDTIYWSMIDASYGGSDWSRATRIWQNVLHAFGIPSLTKSHFGKNQSYEVLTPNRWYNNFTLNSIFRPKAFIKKNMHFYIIYIVSVQPFCTCFYWCVTSRRHEHYFCWKVLSIQFNVICTINHTDSMLNIVTGIHYNLSRGMWFPTLWHFDKCWLRWACTASF